MSHQRVRLTPEERRRQIINAAVDVVLERGLYNFGIVNVARELPNGSKSIIKHHFNMTELRTAVVESALEHGHSKIIAQAITMEHEAIGQLTDEQRQRYLADV